MNGKGKAKKRIAVIGYGSQGRAFALNLRDSGHQVTVGLRSRSRSSAKAKREGLQVVSISKAVQNADLICFAFPDHLHGKVFEKEISRYLRPGATLVFLHGLSVHFGYLHPPDDCDVFLLAPHAPGTAVREKYLGDRSISAFGAVFQDVTGKAKRSLALLAEGIGIQKSRMVKTTFRDEAIGDLFGEQAVLCGGLAMLIKNGFDLLVERGIKPEHAYLEVAYQLDLIIALIKKHGVAGMLNKISVAARYGSIKIGPSIIDSHTKKQMKKALAEIESGRFTKMLLAQNPRQIRTLTKQSKHLSSLSFERAARKYCR